MLNRIVAFLVAFGNGCSCLPNNQCASRVAVGQRPGLDSTRALPLSAPADFAAPTTSIVFGAFAGVWRAAMVVVWLIIVSLAFVTPITAHQWYPQECCGGLDCAEVTEIKLTPDGILATVPGLGRTVLLPKGFKYRPSPDDAVHVCVDNDADTLTPRIKCIFWPKERAFPNVSEAWQKIQLW